MGYIGMCGPKGYGIFFFLFFVEGRKPENPEKKPRSKDENQNKLNPHVAATVGGERSHHCEVLHPCSPDIFKIFVQLNMQSTRVNAPL